MPAVEPDVRDEEVFSITHAGPSLFKGVYCGMTMRVNAESDVCLVSTVFFA